MSILVLPKPGTMNLLRKCFYGSILLLAGLSLNAQSVEDQLTKPVVRCEDVRVNALEVIPHLYQQQPIDSVIRAITFWERTCGLTEELQRIKILVAIKNRHFSELLYDSTIVYYINRFKEIKDLKDDEAGFWQERNPDDRKRLIEYNVFTKGLARSLLPVVDTSSLESYFCYLYADTGTARAILDKPKFEKTSLKRYYSKVQEYQRKQGRGYYAFTGGIWIPTGAATLLGNHPYVGLELGAFDDKNRINLSLNFKFGKSPNTYQIKRNGQLYDTDDFFGGYIGLDYGRKIAGNSTHSLELTAGAGLDGFDVYHTSDEYERDQMKPLSILSYNFNGGVQYSLFYNKRKSDFLGLQMRYNVTNYRNKGGTNLKGNPITVGLVWGMASPRDSYPHRYRSY